MTETHLNRLIAQRKQFLAFVGRRVPDAAVAEDIVQAAYLRAFQHQDGFTTEESVVAWFYRLLRNAIIDSYRRRTAKDKALEAWKVELETTAQGPSSSQDEVCACLHGMIEDLKPEYREILRAVDLGEQPVQEFAAQHKISVSNAGVRAHRARAALRRQIVDTCATCAEHGCLNCNCKQH
jgi:RNA polymerase sigma factor (sigma-70 family)